MKASEVLQQARNDLTTLGWRNYRTQESSGPVPRCLLGRIETVTKVVSGMPQNMKVHDRAIAYVQQATGAKTPFVWNDHPERTLTDVLDAFDHAIKLAKEDEELADA